jgi:predicted transcriptional regulator
MENAEFKNAETISWILLAISVASQSSPATFEDITQIADGINHAVPTQKEMQTSISWLIANDLILKDGKKYTLSENGKNIYTMVNKRSNVLMKIWEHLESEIEQKYNDIA